MKKLLPFLVLLGLLLAAWQFIQYLALPAVFTQQVQDSSAVPNAFKSLLGGSPVPEESTPVEWQVETVATGLQVPWSLAFINDTDFLFTERPGQIRLFQNGVVIEKPTHVFERVRSNQEQGLMGLAVHPEFSENGFVYLCVSEPEGENYTIRISRLKASDPSQPTELRFDRDILTGIAGARVHAGCALVFGPDSKLYVATGDATQKGQAKDQNSLVGKVLRLNEDGSRPEDNPFAGSLVYSRGHRNPQGLAWHSNGSLYSTEHGPSVFDGPAGGDEVNRILAGEYYGWPDVSHEKTLEGARSPIALYTPAEAPASLMAYSGKLFPQFRDNLFFGALKGQGLWRLEIDPSNPDQITKQEKLFGGEYGRIRHVTEAPDGSIYFTTSNRDGRGTAGEEDDQILRLVPAE
jgi:glucose/arabinose dehydrogenase